MNDPKSLKLYIAVLDEVPDHMVPTLVAHAVLGAHLKFTSYHDYDYEYDENGFQLSGGRVHFYKEYMQWTVSSFKKVVLRVNRKEFDKISKLEDIYLAHENTTLGGEKSCAVVCPSYDIPNVLKFAKMWKPKERVVNMQVQNWPEL
jgi:hypothetical protein